MHVILYCFTIIFWSWGFISSVPAQFGCRRYDWLSSYLAYAYFLSSHISKETKCWKSTAIDAILANCCSKNPKRAKTKHILNNMEKSVIFITYNDYLGHFRELSFVNFNWCEPLFLSYRTNKMQKKIWVT